MTIIIKNKETLIYDDFKFRCSIGKKGFTQNKIEGDYKTPTGIFNIGNLYYRYDKFKKPNLKPLLSASKIVSNFIKKKDFIIFISNRTWSGICDLSYRARPQLALKDCRLHYCFNDWMVSMLLPPLPYCFFSQRNVHMLSFQVLMATLLIYMDWYHHNVPANFLHQHNLTILYEI